MSTIEIAVRAIQNTFGTGNMNDWKGRKYYKYSKPALHIAGANEGIIDSHREPCTFQEALALALNGRALIDANDNICKR